jgi:uncharacterized protein YndB with AHSA1/START domain
MQTIQDTIDIPASPAAVWRVLTATQHYGAWNPFIPRLEGELRRAPVGRGPGSRICGLEPLGERLP